MSAATIDRHDRDHGSREHGLEALAEYTEPKSVVVGGLA